ncbi:unnamed protein product [Blepharisma stoltei]|uniref:Uncharacterized protein n=1 Tax=Blepharisma stoltei TaxID=1481888 RepID=A0AAU9IDE7_9CILI|nr:unnamed protein product [Blepharisma stoltei]
MLQRFIFQREKYWIGASAFCLGTFAFPFQPLHYLGFACCAYNVLERLGIIEINLIPDIEERKTKLNQLLRHHLENFDDLDRYISPKTLLLALPKVTFDDQGFLGWLWYKLNIPNSNKGKFYMDTQWKDVKYYGEGWARCQGRYLSGNNYYFTKIVVDQSKPRPRELVILDTDIIEIN